MSSGFQKILYFFVFQFEILILYLIFNCNLIQKRNSNETEFMERKFFTGAERIC